MKTVIMAGGRGTRIASVARDIPKPMIPIGGKPVLERELECLREQGFTEIIITVGHLGQLITDYFGDGSRFCVHIEYFTEQTPLGNAGALYQLKDRLTDNFLLLNADVVFDVDFSRFVEFHRQRGGLATIFTHPNSHPYDSGLVITDGNCAVSQWLAKEDARPAYYRNRVNAGLHVLSPLLLEKEISSEKVDLDRQILKPLAGTGKLFACSSSEYVRDMGTPERYRAVCRDYESGLVRRRNLSHPQKAVFLDRDGTLNRYIGFLRNADEFELLPGVEDAIRRINASGFLAIVATNQPVIARGEVTAVQLDEIHSKMETLLGRSGAYIDGLYYCPHHPDGGFEGEVPELKIQCGCRKPKPGMLYQAAEEFHIDLAASWMVGDSINDIQCGISAGCRTVLIGKNSQYFGQDYTASSLSEAVHIILEVDENAH